LPSGRLKYSARGGAGDDFVDAVILGMAGAGGIAADADPPGWILGTIETFGDGVDHDTTDEQANLCRARPGMITLGSDGLPGNWSNLWR
jgi:hypothetical protein